MKIIGVVQARIGSTRFPGKVLERVGGQTIIDHLLKRLSLVKNINKIVVAIPAGEKDEILAKHCQKAGYDIVRGSEDDVLDRFHEVIKAFPQFDAVIRTTGDCPLIDPVVVDKVIELFRLGGYDYVNNVDPVPTYPDGLDTEVFTKKVLIKAWQEAKDKKEREHVTLFIRNNQDFKKGYLSSEIDYSDFRLTIDNKEDLEVIKFLIENSSISDSFIKYVELLKTNLEIKNKNSHIMRNEGLNR